ncbi:cobalamin-binding protein [Nocardioides eburneiflavus]|uniref:Cobalamin-binding protein n=1 Tax=Nocardioides eburneiflavus TaxID=2518372 RepID=A0A4Z1CNK6_9ACTN|nr:cobalamin-binding protein [Nocardioides eburneiflavus]TGN62534.1 cobalamin-binding protein [Nocardioides eburneiflavus]TGN66552.1 cobalamin-binding protein [Nocardioides eburneiflavus]
MRIVSLIPSATEILFAVGAGDDVVGVTFECDHPAEARERRVVSTSAMSEGLTPKEIDDFVAAAMSAGEDLYRLDAGALADLDTDLVVTQDLCAVCAIDVTTVDEALRHLGCRAEVATVDPHTLDDVLASVTEIGRLTGRSARATALVASLEGRLAAVADRVAGRVRPRVLVLEWTDPPFAPGHWIPEMVTSAGGEPTLGVAGTKSTRISWDEAVDSAPDLVVCAPCGYDLDGAATLAEDVRHRFPGVPVWAVDADGHFARPGPRLVDGVEVLAGILHPDAAEPSPYARQV